MLDHITGLLPGESTVYLGDTARVPYGTRSADTVIRYALECARGLVGLADVKLLVLACNTASAVALPALAAACRIPVIGVIRPGSKAAMQATRGGGIAVLGTSGTIRSGAYSKELRNLGAPGEIIGRACPLLVPLVEEGWVDGIVPTYTLHRYVSDLVTRVDVIVLGCTHYPRLRPLLKQLVPTSIAVVDGGHATALEVQATLQRMSLQAEANRKPTHRIFVTDGVDAMASMAPDFLRIDLHDVLVEHIDLDAHIL